MDPASLVALGVVIGAQGVRGELRFKPYNPSSELLHGLRTVALRTADGTLTQHKLLRAVRHGQLWIIALDTERDRDVAEALRGSEVCVPRSVLPPLEPGEFYLFDLVGMDVANAEGTVVGKVVSIENYPTTDALRVALSDGFVEIPVAVPYFIDVDNAARRVLVTRLEDLPVEPTPAKR